jgi:hypothetical protein
MEPKNAFFISHVWTNGAYDLKFQTIKVIENVSYNKLLKTNIKSEKEYVPKKDDKLFFLPGCTIPRFKMKKFCEEYGTAMVKYQKSATALFIGSDTLKELVTHAPNYKLPKNDVINYFKTYIPQFDVTPIENTNSKNVYFNSSHLKDGFTKNFGHLVKILKPDWKNSLDTMFLSEASFDNYKLIMESDNVYDQSNILKKLNSGAEMTQEQYISIQRLLESTDSSNKKVAIEIMSNCDFEKSAVYLLLLILDYGRTIDECRESRHVNFKSLLKFFGLSNVYKYDINDLVDTLLEKKLLSRNNLEIILPIITKKISDSTGLNYFTPFGITYSEEIYKGLLENILETTHNTVILDDEAETLNPTI